MRFAFFILFCFQTSFAQSADQNLSADLKFGKYLLDADLLSDAELHFSQLSEQFSETSQSTLDSINYYSGWTAYRLQKLPNAIEHLSKVSTGSEFYDKAFYFSALNETYTGNLNAAFERLDRQENESEIFTELNHFQKAGISLMQNNLSQFEKESQYFTYNFYAMSTQQENLIKYAEELRNHKSRSPFLAGLFSAILPGSGKVYAGKGRQGVASILPIAALGFQTWENGRKRGWDNPLTIAYAGLFSIFYIGNIWGSTLSVKIVNDEFKEELDQRILFDLHIPLRTIFP